MFSGKFPPSAVHEAVARVVSLLVAVVGFVCSLPLMALIAIAIKLDSNGPVLFVQARVGANGRPFKLVKFRTMHVTVAPHSEWAADNEARVTRVGKWLRTLRLDELPQFINILRGEMNLVGPRPHPVCNHELFTLVTRNLNETTGSSVSYYHLRSMVRPGLTGWAQVRYRYANNLEEELEKLRYDLYYVKHVSVWLDLRILADTCRVLFSGRLSDGVEDAAPGARLSGRLRSALHGSSTRRGRRDGSRRHRGPGWNGVPRLCRRGLRPPSRRLDARSARERDGRSGRLDRVDGRCLDLGIRRFDVLTLRGMS